MSDDEPQPSKNPFIRFKQHVDARIGAGVAVLSGRERTNSPTPDSSQLQQSPAPQANPSSVESTSTGAPPAPPTDTMSRDAFEPLASSPNVTTAQYWNDWAQLSPYSPYNLRHLPQPVPNDLPADAAADAHLLGFDDAFEDLLAATASRPRPLMDLRRQVDYKRRTRSAFPLGEPPVLWVNRLRDRGLLRRPLPAAHFGELYPGAILQQLEERRLRAEGLDPEERRREESRVWERLERTKEEVMRKLDREITFNPAEWLRQAEQLAREVNEDVQRFNRDVAEGKWPSPFSWDALIAPNDGRPKPERKQQYEPATEDIDDMFADLEIAMARLDELAKDSEKDDTQNSGKKQERQKQPDSDYDLFSAIESAVAEADKSFKGFAKAMFDIGSDDDKESDKDARHAWPALPWTPPKAEESKPIEVVKHDGSGGKTVKSTSEHVDMFGYVHQKTEVDRFDADGNKYSHETRYSVRPGSEKEKQTPKKFEAIESPDSAPHHDDKEKAPKTTDGKSSGWFWR